uniref:Uncharacterized protein n=1 Tax=viral metagenome TaxID=1070528 RepID=A0A6M3IZ56_9ZZZZ
MNLKNNSNIYHSIYCGKPHAMNPEESIKSGECRFYLEEVLSNPWEGEDHKKWLEMSGFFVKNLDISSDEEFLNALRHISNVLKTYIDFKDAFPKGKDTIIAILNNL